jgi:hypothetical protein
MISDLTAFIAVLVALITFLQWVTAREKVRLDLVDKRFAVYDELRTGMGRHLGGGVLGAVRDLGSVGRDLGIGIDKAALSDFVRAVSRAQFLFGPEVQTFLEERQKDLDRETTLKSLLSQPIPEDRRGAAAAELAALLRRLADFFRDFDQLAAPYMNHHQKALPSVFRFRNLPWRPSKL